MSVCIFVFAYLCILEIQKLTLLMLMVTGFTYGDMTKANRTTNREHVWLVNY